MLAGLEQVDRYTMMCELVDSVYFVIVAPMMRANALAHSLSSRDSTSFS